MNMQLDELGTANAWLDVARNDYRSAAEFGQLGLQLIGMGAPIELVTRTQQAGLLASDQHSRCIEIVRLLGGPRVTGTSPTPVGPDHNTRPGDATSVAVTAFHHGVVGHGHAVNCLRRSLASAAAPIAEIMSELVVDTQLQIATSRDIVAWCVETAPSSIVDLHNAARRLPAQAPQHHHATDISSAQQAGRAGLCDAASHQDAWRETVIEATWWLTTALV